MIIGVPKEIKTEENRVAVTPTGVAGFVARNHQVLIQKDAGSGSGLTDANYQAAGATIVDSAKEVWDKADMIMKVKEPQESEFPLLRPGLILFTYLHLAAAESVTRALLDRKVTGIAYETIQLDDGSLPLLAPMSEIAGRLSIQVGAWCLQAENGGRGVLLGGASGVRPANVVIIGAGMSGTAACQVAAGMGAYVSILDINPTKLRYVHDILGGHVTTLMSNRANVEEAALGADLVIGSVLIPGAQAPKIITRALVRRMKPGAALVDIAIDQGGCAETSRPTTHGNPIYVEEELVHYCVTNMPAIVPQHLDLRANQFDSDLRPRTRQPRFSPSAGQKQSVGQRFEYFQRQSHLRGCRQRVKPSLHAVRRGDSMRLVTRADFDGLVCGALVTKFEKIDDYLYVEPKFMQDGLVEIRSGDIITNLPYHPNCTLWFDHHITNTTPNFATPIILGRGGFRLAPSAARVVYEYYLELAATGDSAVRRSNVRPRAPRSNSFSATARMQHLMHEVDRVDAGKLEQEDVLNPQGYVLLSMTTDGRNAGDEPYWLKVINLLRDATLAEVMNEPEIKQRCQRIQEEQEKLRKLLLERTSYKGNVIYCDLRGVKEIPDGNRFLVFTLFPKGNIQVKVAHDSQRANTTSISVGYNIFNPTSNVNVGELLTNYGGGGHKVVGSSRVPNDQAEQAIKEILAAVTE